MNEAERQAIIERSKVFFKETIIKNHLKNTKKLQKLSTFKLNPFTYKYLAKFAFGNTDALSIAKALVYPRALGTSISTSFGTQMQKYCGQVLQGCGSVTSGIDIEFIDSFDGRKKYCQVKSSVQTINKDDVTTIKNHFKGILNLARTNNLDIRPSDCIVGILYGTKEALSANFKNIDKDYPVYIGVEFWSRLTGDEGFYSRLADAFAEVADELSATQILNDVISKLEKEIKDTIL